MEHQVDNNCPHKRKEQNNLRGHLRVGRAIAERERPGFDSLVAAWAISPDVTVEGPVFDCTIVYLSHLPVGRDRVYYGEPVFLFTPGFFEVARQVGHHFLHWVLALHHFQILNKIYFNLGGVGDVLWRILGIQILFSGKLKDNLIMY
jgi:hypothetical protein